MPRSSKVPAAKDSGTLSVVQKLGSCRKGPCRLGQWAAQWWTLWMVSHDGWNLTVYKSLTQHWSRVPIMTKIEYLSSVAEWEIGYFHTLEFLASNLNLITPGPDTVVGLLQIWLKSSFLDHGAYNLWEHFFYYIRQFSPLVQLNQSDLIPWV